MNIIKFKRRCLEIDRFEFLRNRFIYASLFILTGVLGYFAYGMIHTLPHPGTIPEFIKYYFQSPSAYFKATILTFAAFFVSVSLGASTIWQALDIEKLHIAVRIFVVIIGVIIIASSFYFFSYFILLIVSVLILGAIVAFVLSDSGKGRRR
ncbi:hypothetical protein LGL55_18395 [Clostridium tagluense]|uniref:hypothetical protein n=1 Tax=Clostridium tagluense TaxID=360422 RepID=UPI001CF5E5C8|nr:hypothetical protein [Clostridium tagluense]MCB2313254.1 hypothetical protein [Clostridium tagluense]MCB2317995.1 hypothetical protein [Clostridium tagluense]MCB2322809.1 hypothetical protein [Clostridium tagluense]MCB2327779.1 hypothetical protein [Clostridium tagluense]MCB2332426.1 hypothetical protein [Clostridium tagluense]